MPTGRYGTARRNDPGRGLSESQGIRREGASGAKTVVAPPMGSAPAANETGAGSIDLELAGRFALLFSGILSPFALAGLSPVLPAIAAHFAQYPEAGFLTRLLVSMIGAMIVVGSPFVGALADRFGRRRILLIGMLIYAVAGCAGFFLESLYAIVATRVLVGLAVAAVGAVMLAIVVTHSEGAARNLARLHEHRRSPLHGVADSVLGLRGSLRLAVALPHPRRGATFIPARSSRARARPRQGHTPRHGTFGTVFGSPAMGSSRDGISRWRPGPDPASLRPLPSARH